MNRAFYIIVSISILILSMFLIYVDKTTQNEIKHEQEFIITHAQIDANAIYKLTKLKLNLTIADRLKYFSTKNLSLKIIDSNNKGINYSFLKDINKIKIDTRIEGYNIEILLDATHYFRKIDFINDLHRNSSVIAILLILIFLTFTFLWFKEQDSIEELNRKLNIKVESQTVRLNEANMQLIRFNNRLNNVIYGSNLGYWERDLITEYYFVNDRYLDILKLDREDITNRYSDFLDRIHPIDKKHILPLMDKSIQEDINCDIEFRMIDKDGNYVWIESSSAVVERDRDSNPTRISGIHQDITHRKELEEIRNKNRDYLNILFDNNPNIIIVTKSDDILSTNREFFKYFKEYATIDDFKKKYKSICELFEYEEDKSFLHPSKGNWLKKATKDSSSKVLIKYNGQKYYFKIVANATKFEKETLYIVTFTDITQNHILQLQLEQMSIIDELTQLYNRRHFNTIIAQEIKIARREKKNFVFLMMDLDNFKKYNDTYGHDMGDEVLINVAKSFKLSLKRANDYIFRLGGEEFGIIFSNIDYDKSMLYANQIRENIKALQIEHINNDYKVVTVSVGLCFIDFSKYNIDIKEIYSYADKALYKSKESGRNMVSSWSLKG